MTQKNTNPWTFDVRVRERNLKSGSISEKDVEAYIAQLPDLEAQSEPFSLTQPALDGAEDEPEVVAAAPVVAAPVVAAPVVAAAPVPAPVAAAPVAEPTPVVEAPAPAPVPAAAPVEPEPVAPVTDVGSEPGT